MSTTGDSEATTTTAATENSTTNRKQPFPQGFLDTISTGWAERPETLPPARARAAFAARRRAALSAAFPGERLVFPAGELKQRSNDTDYRFRAHSAFSHLTGWGSDAEPGAILVMDPLP
uniref:aminopeptidase P N-terminal domain-containing protein n=1 Tax=Microbacterium sp. TaxID=51671 RepID=UPI002621BA10